MLTPAGRDTVLLAPLELRETAPPFRLTPPTMAASPVLPPMAQLMPKEKDASLLTSMIRASMNTCLRTTSSLETMLLRASNSSGRAVTTRLLVDLSATTLMSLESTVSGF